MISNTLHQKLPLILEDVGVFSMIYDECVMFTDPVACIRFSKGFLTYIEILKLFFESNMQVHYVKQAAPYEFLVRWTTVFIILPWKPELVLTGISIMSINPKTQKCCSQVDRWDSIENNEYYSSEGVWDVLRQLRIYKTPDLKLPKYQILKRTANYEVLLCSKNGDELSTSAGFKASAQNMFGKKLTAQKILTTYINKESPKLKNVPGGIAAVSKFSGKPLEDVICEKAKTLRSALKTNGVKPKEGFLFACYNDPHRTWSFIMRNEVLIWLEDFTLE
ncbi:hypothetical protein AQUCO_00100728v1 [Aquilegia coerulea]|uniref:Uncharacterized protein n=1 Tax=Aquilegia coerulea TaxID=218851 RepID=A0A2G5FBN2_AQUCA|nr:hypothetical protein AQUCO_00100728v1 [Aquilegia coerulea]